MVSLLKNPPHKERYRLSLSNLQPQHKGVQCNLTVTPTEAVSSLFPTGQSPVGAVEIHGCSDSRSAEPEFPMVGVTDSSGGGSMETPTSIYRVREASHTDLFSGWTPEQLITAQKTDPDITPVLGWMEKCSTRPPWADRAACSPATKAYWSQWKRRSEKWSAIKNTLL